MEGWQLAIIHSIANGIEAMYADIERRAVVREDAEARTLSPDLARDREEHRCGAESNNGAVTDDKGYCAQ